MAIHVEYVLDRDDLPQECIDDCSSSGDVTEAVQYWRKHLEFTVDRIKAVDCLAGYGAWERDDLIEMDADDIADKILWLACGTFRDGGTIFVLE